MKRIERHVGSRGFYAFGDEMSVHAPTYCRVERVGVSAKAGLHVILSNDAMRHLYRLLLLSEANVRQGQRLRPGEVVGAAVRRAYYDILRYGRADALYLPSREDPKPELFVDPRLLHDELEGGES